MLQYAVPSAPTSFAKPPSVFAESSSRPSSTSSRTQPPPNIEKPYDPIANARRSSSATQTSHITSQTTRKAEERVDQSHSPALSALASLAANAPVALSLSKEDSGEVSSISSTPSGNNMNPSQYAPAATAGGTQNGPPVCQNCGTSTTPLWRRDEAGSVLCNACGLFLKLHSRPRPISLKTDVIKSRNRVKTSQAKKRDSQGGTDALVHAPNGYAAAHPQSANHEAQTHHGLSSGVVPGEHHPPPLPSPGSLSRSNTPGLGAHNGGIAPQHIFDSVGITPDTFASPNMPSFALRQPSPSGSSLNGNSVGNLDTAQGYDAMVAQNNQLRTRVSELEVINDLFRGRVGELESGEQNARRDAQTKDEEVQRLMADLGSANARVADLEKRLADIQAVENEHDDGPARKRSRTDDA